MNSITMCVYVRIIIIPVAYVCMCGQLFLVLECVCLFCSSLLSLHFLIFNRRCIFNKSDMNTGVRIYCPCSRKLNFRSTNNIYCVTFHATSHLIHFYRVSVMKHTSLHMLEADTLASNLFSTKPHSLAFSTLLLPNFKRFSSSFKKNIVPKDTALRYQLLKCIDMLTF